ncbi:hypothetical protein [Streptomyces sp. enrichment culture]|uniref:hypothetical protein n=1 Tax=Streptomyces sp. enrichment culture TaxID=1795815 RepID=UPI003F561385
MSFSLRRAAVVSLAVLALTAGGAVSAAAAAAPSAPAVAQAGPGGEGGGEGFGGRHEPPMHFGPFEIPKFGSVSGGFSWGLAR